MRIKSCQRVHSENACSIQNSFPMDIKENTDGINSSRPRSPLRLQRKVMRKELWLEHAKKEGCLQSSGSGPRAPPAATCRRSSARPHPRQRLLSSLSNCPLPSLAAAHQLLGRAALAFTAAAAPPAAAAHRPPAPRHLPPFLPLRTP